MSVPITFTVNIPREAIIQAGKDGKVQADRELRERAIAQTVATFIVTISFALIHVSVGALEVDIVEDQQPLVDKRTPEQAQAHAYGIEKLVPGVVGAAVALIVMVPVIRAVQKPDSTSKTHKIGLLVSFVMNMLWCAWFAIMCGVYSRERGDYRVDALDLILALINFVFMLYNLYSSCKTVRALDTNAAESEEKKAGL